MRWLIFVIAVFFSSPAHAEELSVLVGRIEETGARDMSTLWQLEYRQDLTKHFALSVSYLNEGHFPNHHRDGHAIQLWVQTGFLDGRLSLAGGIGPYLYYDTTPEPAGTFSFNKHGWGALCSASATWYTESPLFFQLRGNLIESDSAIDTVSAAFGIGYRFDPPSAQQPAEISPYLDGKTTRNEITVFAGETSVHNRGPSHSTAVGIEYRRSLLRNVDWTASWLYEGENDASRRTGLAAQIWAVKPLLGDRLSLGIGGGPYFAVERLRDPNNDRSGELLAAGLITMTVSYRFQSEWGARFSWNRVITNYSRDSDIWLGGIGYRF